MLSSQRKDKTAIQGVKDLNQYKKLHSEDASYGATGLGYLIEVESLIKRLKFSQMVPIRRVLDFGCGKGSLVSALNCQASLSVECLGYDPAVPEFEKPPKGTVDMLITTDVLEHVPEDELVGVFCQMLAFEPQIMYHIVCCAKARSILPNGTNAHKTIESPCWWWTRLIDEFPEYVVQMLSYNLPGPVEENVTFLMTKR